MEFKDMFFDQTDVNFNARLSLLKAYVHSCRSRDIHFCNFLSSFQNFPDSKEQTKVE